MYKHVKYVIWWTHSRAWVKKRKKRWRCPDILGKYGHSLDRAILMQQCTFHKCTIINLFGYVSNSLILLFHEECAANFGALTAFLITSFSHSLCSIFSQLLLLSSPVFVLAPSSAFLFLVLVVSLRYNISSLSSVPLFLHFILFLLSFV